VSSHSQILQILTDCITGDVLARPPTEESLAWYSGASFLNQDPLERKLPARARRVSERHPDSNSTTHQPVPRRNGAPGSALASFGPIVQNQVRYHSTDSRPMKLLHQKGKRAGRLRVHRSFLHSIYHLHQWQLISHLEAPAIGSARSPIRACVPFGSAPRWAIMMR